MHQEEESLRALQRERAARVKRILRWLPRRATMHRYPVLKWFAKSARQRPYLWSFRSSSVVPALYAGCILSLLPLYGVQLALSVMLAFLLRANLPVLVGLQAITNPFSAVPIYYAAYQIGRIFLKLFGISPPHLNLQEISAVYRSMATGDWSHSFTFLAMVWGLMAIGGAMMGIFIASISSAVYKLGAKEAAITFNKIQELQEKRKHAAEAAANEEGHKTVEASSDKSKKPVVSESEPPPS